MIQIVPRLGSTSDGVADYARALAVTLRGQEGIGSLFIKGDPRNAEGDGGVDAVTLAERTAGEVVRTLEAAAKGKVGVARTAVLLHYANYGYAHRGCPFWLVGGLERWKRNNPQALLLVMFHELYAFGPPWHSSFWLSSLQRRLAGRLARVCDYAVSSSGLYRRMIAGLAPEKAKQILVHPVFSTIGEPRHPVPWRNRKARLAVLGRAGTEGRVYEHCAPALAAATKALGIEEIVDIGPRLRVVPSQFVGIEVKSVGQLPGEEVSKLLSECRAGFLDYPSDVLGKSTVFAAYCAHGAVPVISRRRGADLDGLQEGKNYLVARAMEADTPLRPEMQEGISEAAVGWYSAHSVGVQARALAGIIA